MSDSFGKIVSIWIGCILLFLLPVLFYAGEQERAEKMYILTETAYFVDSVRNTGRLTDSMLLKFEQKLSGLSGLYRVEMEHSCQVYGMPKEAKEYSFMQDCYYTKQIREQLQQTKEYLFYQGDFFKVSVVEVKKGIGKAIQEIFIGTEGIPEGTVAYYGGMIRCEME